MFVANRIMSEHWWQTKEVNTITFRAKNKFWSIFLNIVLVAVVILLKTMYSVLLLLIESYMHIYAKTRLTKSSEFYGYFACC